MVASSDAAYVFVVTQGNGSTPGTVDIINTANDTIGGSVPVGVGPTSISLDTVPQSPLRRQHRRQLRDRARRHQRHTGREPAHQDPGDHFRRFGAGVGGGPAQRTRLLRCELRFQHVSVVSSSSFGVVGTVPVGNNPIFIATRAVVHQGLYRERRQRHDQHHPDVEQHRRGQHACAAAGPELRSRGLDLPAAAPADDHDAITRPEMN